MKKIVFFAFSISLSLSSSVSLGMGLKTTTATSNAVPTEVKALFLAALSKPGTEDHLVPTPFANLERSDSTDRIINLIDPRILSKTHLSQREIIEIQNKIEDRFLKMHVDADLLKLLDDLID